MTTEKRKPGRPPVAEEDKARMRSIRLTNKHHTKFEQIGRLAMA